MERDPLSLFASDSSSSDTSDCEQDNGRKSLKDQSYYTSSETSKSIKRLPSPNTLFSTVKKPDFLSAHISSHQVNWDSLAKTIETEQETIDEENGRTHATIPPPPEHNEEVDPRAEISSDPIKYTITNVPVNSKLLTVSSSNVNTKTGEKRRNNDDIDATKRPKGGESFKDKEKRKRDLGMTSRGKSFVEEEKRILREQFD